MLRDLICSVSNCKNVGERIALSDCSAGEPGREKKGETEHESVKTAVPNKTSNFIDVTANAHTGRALLRPTEAAITCV